MPNMHATPLVPVDEGPATMKSAAASPGPTTYALGMEGGL